jgi:hypothetical protein
MDETHYNRRFHVGIYVPTVCSVGDTDFQFICGDTSESGLGAGM